MPLANIVLVYTANIPHDDLRPHSNKTLGSGHKWQFMFPFTFYLLQQTLQFNSHKTILNNFVKDAPARRFMYLIPSPGASWTWSMSSKRLMHKIALRRNKFGSIMQNAIKELNKLCAVGLALCFDQAARCMHSMAVELQ